MKNTGILAGFIPLIVYGLLAGSTVSSVIFALFAAIIVTVGVGFPDLKKGRILSWATLLLFCFLFVAVGVMHISGIIPVTGILIYATLAAVTVGSIIAGIPFTIQYAREMVDTALWENPVFIRVNILITGVWGSIFVINGILSYFLFSAPERAGWIMQVLIYGMLAAGIVFTIWYPRYLQKKHARVPTQDGTEKETGN